jgi:hypothetical protein
MTILIFAALAFGLGYMIWERRVPSDDWLLSEARSKTQAMLGSDQPVECARIQPKRLEEQQSADAWLACRYDGLSDGDAHLLYWNDRIEGRRELFLNTTPTNLERDDRWNF